MSDRYSGNRCNQTWVRHYSGDQNVLPHSPFAITNYSDPSAINAPGEHLLLHPLEPINYFIPKPPPTTNLRIGMCGRGGAKAYFRFHGGIGDGRGGIGWRATDDKVAARPLQLFQALDPVDFDIEMIKKAAAEVGSVKNPVTGTQTEVSAGTGVFLPAYPTRRSRWKWVRSTKNNNGGKCLGDGRVDGGSRVGEQKKQEANFEKHFVKDEEHKDLDEIPIELLLPPEWPY